MKQFAYWVVLLITPPLNVNQNSVTIVNEQFASKPFGFELTPETISKMYAGKIMLEKRPMNNEFSEKMDTLLIFKFLRSKVSFYKLPDRILFLKATIIDNGIRIANDIQIGQTKMDFLKLFSSEKLKDHNSFRVTDKLGYSDHLFYFENDRLKKVVLHVPIN